MGLGQAHREAWERFLSAHGRVLARIDADLIASCDMSLAEFEVLHHLAEASDGRMRMNELADRARLSPSGLTRRFDTLVRRGWVERERCDADRRGVNAVLTDVGAEALRSARPVHDRGVTEYFFDHLGPSDVECMAKVMESIAEANAPGQRQPQGS